MAVLASSYEVESAVRTTLKNTISPTATTGIQLNYALTITSGVLRFDPDTDREEFISFGATTVAGGITTLMDVVRNLNLTGDTFAGSGTGYQHSGGSCVVELCNFHALYNLKANKDRANTFTAPQTMGSTNKLHFFDVNSWIYSDGTDIYLRSPAQSQVSLNTLAAAAGVDEKVKITAADTTPGNLSNKMSAGDGIVFSVTNPAGNEILDIDIELAATPGLEFSGGALKVKIKANEGILIDGDGLYWDEGGSYSPTGTWNWTGATMNNIEALRLVDTKVYGETITADQALAVYGNTRVYQAQSDVLNAQFGFIGTAGESGVLGDTKKVNMMGPVIDISGITATNGKTWAGESQTVGGSSIAVYGNAWYGQTITIPALQTRIDRIDLNLTAVGAPTGSYTCAIYATTGGVPTGAALASVSRLVTSMATGVNSWAGFNLIVTPGTMYAIVLYNASATAVDHYTWTFNNANPYAGGTRVDSADAGVNWATSPTNDMVFYVYYFSLAGTDLYLTNTDGVLGTLPGTYFQRVARGLSDSKAVMNVGSPSIYATFTWASFAPATIDTTITLGFRPRYIAAICQQPGFPGASNGFWHHTIASGKCMYSYETSGGVFIVNMADCLGKSCDNGAAPAIVTLAVQSVGADSVTLRRVGTSGTNNPPGGIVHMAIFG